MNGGVWLVLAVLTGGLALAARRRPEARLDLTFLAYVGWPLRIAAYRARRGLALRRGPPRLAIEPMDGLFDYLDEPERTAALAREADLRLRYELDPIREGTTRAIYRENLYFLDLLDALVSVLPPGEETLRAIDVGSQDFRYAPALERWLRLGGRTAGAGRAVELDGIELDGHVVYRDLRSRADYAEAFAGLTSNPRVRYRVEDFLATRDRDRDVVFAFFPFVLRYALVQWGLPMSAFAPRRMLDRMAHALRPGGVLVVATHTHEERAALVGLLGEQSSLEIVHLAPARSALVDYAAAVPERSLVVARRVPNSSEPDRADSSGAGGASLA